MEKLLEFPRLFSLKEMALWKAAVHLYSDSDVSASISGLRLHWFSLNESRLVRREIIAMVKTKVLKLGLPTSITKQLIEIGTPIFLQIKRWRDQLEYHLKIKLQEISLSYSKTLCWTPAGLIDHRKTAERLVCCDVLDVVQRYKLACFNCLDEYIPLFWVELSKEKKDYFYNEVRFKKRFAPCLHFCWPYILKGELSKLDSVWNIQDVSKFNIQGETDICLNLTWDNLQWNIDLTSFHQWAFIHSALNGNKAATEYFFRELTLEEKEASLTRTAKKVLSDLFKFKSREGDSEILCYLVSLMNPEQQMETIKADPVGVFMCILDCPWPDLFLEIASLFWSFFPQTKYDNLLRSMLDVFEDHYFPKLFREFFIQSPPDFKKLFVNHNYHHKGYAFRFLSIFFNFEDSESIELLFGNLSAADRLRTMIRYDVVNLFHDCMLQNKWHMVEVCLLEGVPSEKDREIFKDSFISFLTIKYGGPIDIADPKWKKLFEFLDEINVNDKKEKKAQKRKLDNCYPE